MSHPAAEPPERAGRDGPQEVNTFLDDALRRRTAKRVDEADARRAARPVRAAGRPTGRDGCTGLYAEATLRMLCDEVGGAPEGTRNTVLNDNTLRAHRLLVANGLANEVTVDDALATSARWAGLGSGEVAATMASARRAAAEFGPAELPESVHDVGALTFDPFARGAVVDQTTSSGLATEPPYEFVDGATFIFDTPPIQDACMWGDGCEVLWAAGESLMVAGPMGLGKTTLGLRLLRARLGLDGGRLLGYSVWPVQGTILYLAMDRPDQIARAAARMFGHEERDLLRERVKFWKGPPPWDVAKHPGILTTLADAAGASEVYLDSVKDAALGLSEDEVGAGYNRARQQLLASDRQLVELHHTTKRGQGGGPPTAVADIYGSAWITNGTGSIVLLTGDPGDPIVGMRHVRSPADEVGPFQLLHDQQTGTMTVHHHADIVELAGAKGEHGLTARDVAAALFGTDAPTAAQKERARRKLDALAKAGALIAVGGGTGGAKGGASTVWFRAVEVTP